MVGDHASGQLLASGAFEDLHQGVIDAFDMLDQLVPIIAKALVGDIDEPAGIDDIIGGVENPTGHQVLIVALLGELIICGARHYLGAQLGRGTVVER